MNSPQIPCDGDRLMKKDMNFRNVGKTLELDLGVDKEKNYGHLEQCRFRRVIGYQCR